MSVYPGHGSKDMGPPQVDQGPPPPHYDPPPPGHGQIQAPYQQPMHQQPMHQQPIHQQQQSTTNVVVVNQQPAAETRLVLGSVYGHRDFTTGLFSCTEDFGGCMKTLFCYECALMEMSAKLNENVCVTTCVPGSLVTLRTRLRTLGGIQGSICKDYCVLSWCHACAVCQMDREIKAMQL